MKLTSDNINTLRNILNHRGGNQTPNIVYDKVQNSHLILTNEHPVFDKGTKYDSMLYFYNVLDEWIPVEGESIQVWSNDSQMRKQITGIFNSFTKTMKYKVTIDGVIKYYRNAQKIKR